MFKNLFHYTDVGAVRSILEKCELWLTDIRFLNDSQELNEGVSYVLEALKADIYDGSLVEHLVSTQEMLSSNIRNHVSHYINIEPTFVCSFSEAGDQLSQWRAYGDYAIEFDPEVLDLDLFKCIYDAEGKRREAKDITSSAVYGVVAERLDNQGAFGPESERYLQALVRAASTIKDQSFHEEREVRCLVDVHLPSDSLDFREKSGMLVPYIIEKIPFEAIKAVHVGPMRNQELACTAMKAFILTLRHKRISEYAHADHKINVIMSKIPYRSL